MRSSYSHTITRIKVGEMIITVHDIDSFTLFDADEIVKLITAKRYGKETYLRILGRTEDGGTILLFERLGKYHVILCPYTIEENCLHNMWNCQNGEHNSEHACYVEHEDEGFQFMFRAKVTMGITDFLLIRG